MKRYLIPIAIVAMLGGAAYAYFVNHRAVAPLSGRTVSRDIAGQRAVAVVLDNYSPDARPQSGLDRADVVFETLAEGGITRFLAIYQGQDASVIGPVRSARLYFNSWVAGVGAIFGHDGGNVDALQQLPSLGNVFNIDAGRATEPFWRVSSRLAPHNEYTSTTRLRSYANSHGAAITGPPFALPHKPDAPRSGRPGTSQINITFSYGDYNVSWR